MKSNSYNHLSIHRNFIYDIPYFFPYRSFISEIVLPLINLYPKAAKAVDMISNSSRCVTWGLKPPNKQEAIKKILSKNSIFYRCFNQRSLLSGIIFSINFNFNLHPAFSRSNPIIRTVHEIFLIYCTLMEKQILIQCDLSEMTDQGRNTAIQIRAPILKRNRQNFFYELIEKITHLFFLLFPSQNTKEIALIVSAANSLRIAFQKWNPQKPLETVGYCLIAGIKNYPIYAAMQTPKFNYLPKENNFFLDALIEDKTPDF